MARMNAALRKSIVPVDMGSSKPSESILSCFAETMTEWLFFVNR